MGHLGERRAALPSNHSFGFIFTAFFLAVALLPLFRGGAVRLWALAASVVVVMTTLVVPKALTPFNAAWMAFGRLVNRVTSPIVLGLMYYVVIVPAGLVLRLMKKDPLRLHRDTNAATYWIPRVPPGPSAESLERQF